MIERVHIKNFGCIKETELQLTPLHAFIGPNDSGKTTVLRALASAVTTPGNLYGDRSEWRLVPGAEQLLSIGLGDGFWASRWCDSAHADMRFSRGPLPAAQQNISNDLVGGLKERLAERTGPTRFVRLDPDSMRSAEALLKQGEPIALRDEKGAGLPALLDAIRDRGDGTFDKIADELRAKYPTVRFLQLERDEDSRKRVAVELTNGLRIGAKYMSEGMLYYIAILAIQYSQMPKMILFEEPENGLHPARIADVMRILRDISKTTQVVVATHSPLVINEMKPEEVTVLTRTPEDGTRATLIKDTPGFEERAKVYALGELWVSYADGVEEAPLLKGEPRP